MWPAVLIGIAILGLATKVFAKDKPALAPGTNPPMPPGYKQFTGTVTKEIQDWAVEVVWNASQYPMHELFTREFNGVTVVARPEWHTWTIRNGVKQYGKYRGCTMYQPV